MNLNHTPIKISMYALAFFETFPNVTSIEAITSIVEFCDTNFPIFGVSANSVATFCHENLLTTFGLNDELRQLFSKNNVLTSIGQNPILGHLFEYGSQLASLELVCNYYFQSHGTGDSNVFSSGINFGRFGAMPTLALWRNPRSRHAKTHDSEGFEETSIQPVSCQRIPCLECSEDYVEQECLPNVNFKEALINPLADEHDESKTRELIPGESVRFTGDSNQKIPEHRDYEGSPGMDYPMNNLIIPKTRLRPPDASYCQSIQLAPDIDLTARSIIQQKYPKSLLVRNRRRYYDPTAFAVSGVDDYP